MNAKLSLQQKQILVGVYLDLDRMKGRKCNSEVSAERAGLRKPDEPLFLDRMLKIEGVPWRPSRYRVLLDDDWSKSDSAIMSRALHRLEKRGLVELHNHVSGEGRTTRVKLTPEGEEVAKRLAKEHTENASRFDVMGNPMLEKVPRVRKQWRF